MKNADKSKLPYFSMVREMENWSRIHARESGSAPKINHF